jgi:hypothetical protein
MKFLQLGVAAAARGVSSLERRLNRRADLRCFVAFRHVIKIM